MKPILRIILPLETLVEYTKFYSNQLRLRAVNLSRQIREVNTLRSLIEPLTDYRILDISQKIYQKDSSFFLFSRVYEKIVECEKCLNEWEIECILPKIVKVKLKKL